MDVLFVGALNNAGALTSISDAINRHTSYTAECVFLQRPNYIRYPGGKCLQDRTTQEWLREVLPDTRALCFSMFHPLYYFPLFNFTPHYKGKRMVCMHHGTRLRRNPPVSRGIYDFHVAPPELTRYGDFIRYLPWPLSVPSDYPVGKRREHFTIGHDVTSYLSLGEYMRGFKRPELYPQLPSHETVKTSHLLFETCRGLGVRYEAHGGMTWAESLTHKTEVHAYYDQLLIGDFGRGAMEAMYLGVPTITWLCDHSKRVMRDWNPLPYPGMDCDYWRFPDALKEALRRDDWHSTGRECADWVRKFFDPRETANRWVEALFEETRAGARG